MSKDLFMVCWIGLTSAVLWSSGGEVLHVVALALCTVSAGLEAGNGEGQASSARTVVRIAAFTAFAVGIVSELYFGTIRFFR